ncbi:MAG: hypothetical protein U1E23_10910 [Reyranellaceae bacterium]
MQARLGMAVAVLAFGWFAGASAQDGLKRFESEIKPQLELKKFTYESAAPRGDSGFVLNNVVAVIPGNPATGDKESTVRIDRIVVDELDFERLKKGAPDDAAPRFARLKFEGMSGDDEMFTLLAPYGVPKEPVDLALDYRLDTAAKVFNLKTLEVGLRGQARIGLAMVLDGISDKTSEMQGAKDNGRLRTATLDIDDTGLLAKVVPAIAKEQGAKPADLVAQALVPLAAFTSGQGPATLKALDAIASFIGDWAKPAGPIKITVAPAKTASMADLEKIMMPNALSEIFGLSVDYAGTRAGAAAAGLQAMAPPSAPSAGAGAGAGDKTSTGGEAWMSVVGNTLTGKVDGEVFFEHYRKDGTTALLQDSDIIKGKWMLEGEKVCFKYPDEDKDCYTISRTGDEVTMLDAKGKGLRMKLLAGNPKNL